MDRSLSETNAAFNVPVFTLPTEMAAEIFVYCIPPVDDAYLRYTAFKKTVLTDVFWPGENRDTTFTFPTLWRTLSIPFLSE
jgi:hypothetical protein